jgi:signal transduction histidine kinase
MDTTILGPSAGTIPAHPDAGPSPTAVRWRTALRTAAVVVVAAVFCALVQGPDWRRDPTLAVVNLRTSLAFVFAGYLLSQEKGQRGTGRALMLMGILRSVDFISAWNGPWHAYQLIFGGTDRLFGAWALLRYPNQSLPRRQRLFLGAFAAWLVAGRALVAVTSTAVMRGGSAAWWWPTLFPDKSFSSAVFTTVSVGEGLFAVTLLVMLATRLARARGLDRITLVPVIAAGCAAVIAAIGSVVASATGSSSNDAFLTESLIDFAVPVAFLLAVVQRALLLRNITALAARVSAGADASTVQHALRTMLHDPTLDLVDLTGDTDPPAATGASDRLVEFITGEDGAPIAAVIADPALERYRGVFDAAVRTSGLALRNAQLQAEAARQRLEQVRASRARVIEAELAERRRLERDLHDGVQQRLLSITAQLAAARTMTDDEAASAVLADVGDGLGEALAELRDLAHGIHPASLAHGGLAAALEEVADRLPLPATITIPPGRLAEPTEITLYYVAREALANVVKHAQATTVSVTVRIEESVVLMEIADDGAGGAGSGDSAGHGLTNIADRVLSLDGKVSIDSPPGGGTHLVVRIPCA